jgi:GWxTD domain-containing protein
VVLRVEDEAGRQLHRESWQAQVPGAAALVSLRSTDVSTVSPLSVALRPGVYRIEVRMGAESVARSEVHAFDAPPLLSDLVTSTSIRAAGQDEALAAGEIRKGAYAIAWSPQVRLSPADPSLWYYVELYAVADAAPATAQLTMSILPFAGGEPLLVVRREVAIAPPGGADAGKLDVTGLPPGHYRLALEAELAGRHDRREAEFRMQEAEPEPAAAPAAGLPAVEAALFERYFSPVRMDSGRVAGAIDAMTETAPGPTVPKYARELGIEAKRRFLAQHWSRIADPDPSTPGHQLLEEYLERVEYANDRYGEPRIGRPGVHTARGRIYLRFGRPDVVVPLRTEARGEVEIWRYTGQRDLKYVFLDETGFGDFQLILSNDRNEPGFEDWQERVGNPDVVRTILDYL